jgi:hypothetical protein
MQPTIDKERLAAWAAGPPAVQRLKSMPLIGPLARTVWRWRFNRLIEERFRARNAEGAAAFGANVPLLGAAQRGVLDGLRRQGIAIVRAEELFGGREPLASLTREVDAWLASADVQTQESSYRHQSVEHNYKDYLVRMFAKGEKLRWDSPWLQFAAHPRVLDVVNSYLGLHARLNYVDVWNTLPLDREGPDIGSQRWHRDPEAPRMVKVFTYFTDVTPDAGPLIVIPSSRRGGRYGQLWPQEFPRGSHPPPNALERRIPKSEWVTCTVPAGTMVFADTSAFHRGGRANRSRRVLSVANYVPPASFWPRTFDVDRDTIPDDLPPSARFALLSPDA